MRTITSLVTILTIMILISGCGSDSQAAIVSATPTIVGDIPTATPGSTPTATAISAATPGKTPAATTASVVANVSVPTKAPVPTQAPTQGSQPTPTPVPTKAPTAAPTATPTAASVSTSGKVTVWIQVTDSCRQALPGGTFTVRGPGVSTTTSATSGSVHVTISTGGGCPVSQGNCSINVGCTSADLNVPSSGKNIYKITIAQTATGWGTNNSFAVCEGGSDCPHGPEVATVSVSSSGSISATTLNYYPDGTTVTYGPFTGTSNNPIMFHEFGIAANTAIQCDNDSDADDYLTGTPGSHCDSDGPGK